MFMEIFIVEAWSIRKERNNFLFNNITPELESWKRRFIRDFSLLIHRTKEDLHPFISSFANSLSFLFFLSPILYNVIFVDFAPSGIY
jgi:hypothetical protein